MWKACKDTSPHQTYLRHQSPSIPTRLLLAADRCSLISPPSLSRPPPPCQSPLYRRLYPTQRSPRPHLSNLSCSRVNPIGSSQRVPPKFPFNQGNGNDNGNDNDYSIGNGNDSDNGNGKQRVAPKDATVWIRCKLIGCLL